MIVKARVALISLLVIASTVGLLAADWPWYLGPDRNGTSPQKGVLRSWPKEGPKVVWTIPVGVGFGGPAVSAGRLYLLDRDEQVGDTLRVFDFASGKELWSFAYDAPGKFMFPGSRTTPTVDGDLVFICGPLGDLHAVSITTHKPVWHKNIWTDFGGGAAGGPPSGPPGGREGGRGGPPAAGSRLPTWGIVQNPLVYGSLVIVAAQAAEATVVAFDKLTGELKWKSAVLTGGVGYVTPSIVKIGTDDHLVTITASRGAGRNASGGGVIGLDPRNGRTLWTYENWQCSIPVPHAVDAGQGRVLITGGYRAGAAMIKIEKKADGTFGVTELFKNPDFGAHTQPPVLYKDHFYAHYTTNEQSSGLVCMTMDGQVKWKTGEDPAFVRGGTVLADGLLLVTDGNTMLYLVEPDPAGFKPLASAVMLEAGTNWAPLALVDGKLLIRDQKQLKCVTVAR